VKSEIAANYSSRVRSRRKSYSNTLKFRRRYEAKEYHVKVRSSNRGVGSFRLGLASERTFRRLDQQPFIRRSVERHRRSVAPPPPPPPPPAPQTFRHRSRVSSTVGCALRNIRIKPPKGSEGIGRLDGGSRPQRKALTPWRWSVGRDGTTACLGVKREGGNTSDGRLEPRRRYRDTCRAPGFCPFLARLLSREREEDPRSFLHFHGVLGHARISR
jgi:hypothetical protein